MLEKDEVLTEEVKRSIMRKFLRCLQPDTDLLIFLDEFKKECERRGIMQEKADIYETNAVGRKLANLLAGLAELDFDMRMWEKMVAITIPNKSESD